MVSVSSWICLGNGLLAVLTSLVLWKINSAYQKEEVLSPWVSMGVWTMDLVHLTLISYSSWNRV